MLNPQCLLCLVSFKASFRDHTRTDLSTTTHHLKYFYCQWFTGFLPPPLFSIKRKICLRTLQIVSLVGWKLFFSFETENGEELRTTPIKSIEVTKTRLIKRLDVQSEDVEDSGVEGDRVVEKTVFASNKTKTIMLPRFLKSPMSSFVPVTSSPSRTSVSGCRLEVPTAPTWS